MPTEPDSTGGYVSYGALFILWLTRYLHNYIGCFPYQHGYIILEMITYIIAKAVTNSNLFIFRYPVLSDTKHVEVFKLGFDSWADT